MYKKGKKKKMQQHRYVYPVDLTGIHAQVDFVSDRLGVSKAEAIRDAIAHYHDYVKGMKVIEIRDISKKQAEKEILQYVKQGGGVYTSEIADHLRIDVVLVNEILHELASRGKINESS